MSVRPWCEKCANWRDRCAMQSTHKRYTGWVADWKPGGRSKGFKRMRELFSYELNNPRERAEEALSAWKTDFKRNKLGFMDGERAITTFGPLADKYWIEHAMVEGRKPERTTRYLVDDWKEWIGPDRKVSPLSPDELTAFQNDMRALQRKLKAKGLAGATINRQFNIGRSILERGREWGMVKVNPLEFVPRVQEDETHARFLEQKEIDHLFRTVADLKDKDGKPIEPERIKRLQTFMTVISHTGARPSSIEECSFDNGDVDYTNQIIWFTTYKGGRKRKKHRYPVPMDEVMFPLVVERGEITGRRGLVFDTASIRELEVMAIEQSKLNEGKPDNQRFTMYGLKHCYASHLLMQGASLHEVGKLLGHTDGRMVDKHYGHLTLDHLRKVQAKINLTRQMPALKVV